MPADTCETEEYLSLQKMQKNSLQIPVKTEEYLSLPKIFLMTVVKYSCGNSELGCAKSALDVLIQPKLACDQLNR